MSSASPRKIILATRNPGKLREILAILGDLPLEWQTLCDYPNCPEAVESFSTYRENASEKARVAAIFCKEWVLADDSGLEVEALGGAPGVFSARFAGAGARDKENNQKLLAELARIGKTDSPASFRCLMVLRNPGGEEWIAEGEWRGRITERPRGKNGFGYDPLFFLPELGKTSAELPPNEKNRISHRARALEEIKKQRIIVESSG